MKTPGCLAARLQLEAALAAGGPRDRLTGARREAALKCFGIGLVEDSQDKAGAGHPVLKPDRAAPSSPVRDRVPPLAAEPLRLRPEPALPVITPVPPPASGLPAVPGPAVITICDAAGCWDSSGARYNQQGPVLLGPRGLCTAQAGLLTCN